jgi:enoyl-CoA hydratase/carnithine racemase
MQLTSVDLQLSDDGRTAHIVVPGGRLGRRDARELAAAAESLRENREVRVVTLAAASAPFCEGPGEDLDVHELRPDPASALARLRPPIVALVDGACRGEGLELLLATDIRIGTPRSSYALDHVVSGRIPTWGGTQRLARCVRPGTAVSMALLGDSIDAATAKQLGLLHGVVEDLAAEMERLVEALTARGPLALEFTKEAVHRGSELPLRDGLRLEGDLNHQLAATEDRAEGLLAFFEKRPPDFSGR